MHRLWGRLALCGLLAFLPLAAGGCGARSGETQVVTTRTDAGNCTSLPAGEVAARKNALLRFAHAVPGLASADLFANDNKAFDGATYKTVTAYRELPSASAAFRLRLSGQDSAEPLAEDGEALGTGRHHTVVAFPSGGTGLFSKEATVELRFIADEFESPAAGRAKVRVINASPDLEEIDLYAAGRAEPLAKGAKFGAATAYAEADPAGAGLEVRRAGENITTLALPGVKMEAGGLYTIFIVGGTKGTSKLESFVIEDRLAPASAARP